MKPLAAIALCAALAAAGCHLSAWSWSSDSGTHELSLPPKGAPSPEPTPLSRY